MKTFAVLLVSAVLVFALSVSSIAAVPGQFSMQGKLTDAAGTPLPAGPKTFWLRIYASESGGSSIWSEGQVITTDLAGLWTASVGASNPFTPQVFADSLRWLEIEVETDAGSEIIQPRTRLLSTPYSMRVGSINGSTGGVVTGSVITGSGHVVVSGTNVFVAGLQDTVDGDHVTIAGGTGHRAEGEGAFIGGGIQNVALFGAVVAGGQYNAATGPDGTVAGGRYNESDDGAFVGGGLGNSALGVQSTIGGGHGNAASAIGASVGGGFWNKARGDYSVVCGGGRYSPQDSNVALGSLSFVGGGGLNIASGDYSAVVGGEDNLASGVHSAVPGGYNNRASDTGSMAAGSFAIASHPHSFVWGDGRLGLEAVTSDSPNQFLISATNGVRFDKQAGSSKTIRLGDHYRDNGIVAWAKVRSDGLVSTAEFGVASVVRNSAGNYTVTLDVSAASVSLLIATATAEVAAAPTSATTLRIASIRQVSANTFDVYMSTGAGLAVDNDFVFMATAR